MSRLIESPPAAEPTERAQKATMMSVMRSMARVVGWVGVAFCVGTVVAHIFDGDVQQLIALAVLAPFGIPVGLVTVAAFVGARSIVGLAIAVLLVVVGVVEQWPTYVRHHPPTATGAPLTVFSGNMRLGMANAADIVREATADGADVVALQEVTPDAVSRLERAGILDSFPYSMVAAGPTATGVALWSARPLADQHSYGGFTFREVSATLTYGSSGNRVEVFSTHMVAPWPGPASIWTRELASLATVLRAQDEVTIDAGDFNATMDNAQFRALLQRSGYKDAATQSGAGAPRTYPADSTLPPLIGIDHALAKGATAVAFRTVPLPGSDHRGFLARFVLPTTSP